MGRSRARLRAVALVRLARLELQRGNAAVQWGCLSSAQHSYYCMVLSHLMRSCVIFRRGVLRTSGTRRGSKHLPRSPVAAQWPEAQVHARVNDALEPVAWRPQRSPQRLSPR